jgi:hypothetical protein
LKLVGWSYVDERGGTWCHGTPVWLRAWRHVVLLDRFAYPVAVRLGYLHGNDRCARGIPGCPNEGSWTGATWRYRPAGGGRRENTG